MTDHLHLPKISSGSAGFWILTVGIMSMKRNSQAKKMKAAAAARNDTTGEGDDNDVGALIYREVQLRKGCREQK